MCIRFVIISLVYHNINWTNVSSRFAVLFRERHKKLSALYLGPFTAKFVKDIDVLLRTLPESLKLYDMYLHCVTIFDAKMQEDISKL